MGSFPQPLPDDQGTADQEDAADVRDRAAETPGGTLDPSRCARGT